MKSLAILLLGLWMSLGVPAWAVGAAPLPVGALPVSSPDTGSDQAIWTGKSGGFAIRWTTADLEAQPLKQPDRVAFSARALAPSRKIGSNQGLIISAPKCLKGA